MSFAGEEGRLREGLHRLADYLSEFIDNSQLKNRAA
jgi:hypothetical protein